MLFAGIHVYDRADSKAAPLMMVGSMFFQRGKSESKGSKGRRNAGEGNPVKDPAGRGDGETSRSILSRVPLVKVMDERKRERERKAEEERRAAELRAKQEEAARRRALIACTALLVALYALVHFMPVHEADNESESESKIAVSEQVAPESPDSLLTADDSQVEDTQTDDRAEPLEELRDRIEALERAYEAGYGDYGYTSESNSAWNAALEEAKGMLDEADPSEDDVAAMAERLYSAFEGLVPNRDAYEMYGMESVFFGSYEQDGNASNGAEPIEWIVLERDGDRCLLLSKYALEFMAYHERTIADPASWYSSTLRSWLEEDFLEVAFTQGERQGIEATPIVSNAGSTIEETTYDEVFLLDEQQVEAYLEGNALRRCFPAAHVASLESARHGISDDGTVGWWLIQLDGDLYTPIVRADGAIEEMRDNESAGIRPAMWVSSSSLQ